MTELEGLNLHHAYAFMVLRCLFYMNARICWARCHVTNTTVHTMVVMHSECQHPSPAVASGWVEVSSTRSSGGQDPAGGSVAAGRGGRGRGRGRGRYDQEYSGGRGQSDNHAGRGLGALPSSLLHVCKSVQSV